MDTFGLYESGTRVTDQPEILFARQDVKEVLERAEKLHAGTGCRSRLQRQEARREKAAEEETGDRHRAKGRDHL